MFRIDTTGLVVALVDARYDAEIARPETWLGAFQPLPVVPMPTNVVGSWAPGRPLPDDETRCSSCGKRYWWVAPSGQGGCLACCPVNVPGPVRRFGPDFRQHIHDPQPPEREPEHAVVKRGRG